MLKCKWDLKFQTILDTIADADWSENYNKESVKKASNWTLNVDAREIDTLHKDTNA